MTKTNEAVGLHRLGRRAFTKNGTLFLAAATTDPSSLLAQENAESVRIGLITDLHYANKPPAGTRYYRETLDKFSEAAERFSQSQLAFLVELGDLIDSAPSVAAERRHLKRINRELSASCPNRHYVLGNHCVHTLTKHEFLDEVERPASYYSFDHGDFHFVVLDACFRSDGQPYGRQNFVWTDPNIPNEQLEWLKGDLANTNKKTIVFAHQRLDVSSDYGIKNAEATRNILQESNRVLAVFQGHSHKNDHHEIGGIHYCTLVAMVEGSGPENSGYSVLKLQQDGTIQLAGFQKQQAYQW